ncbi:unnamed protein product [Ostreobium quekettii]|uniref:Uncharacterized protein n=1 Tax=Ostreobium quekettii TaxID=121088 RepID=A0A8S1ITH1_9CHLO|nr:unnamed protein product [Ostreobium quekettii]
MFGRMLETVVTVQLSRFWLNLTLQFQQSGVDVLPGVDCVPSMMVVQKHADAVNAILQTRGKTVQGKDACWKVMKCHWGKHPDSHTETAANRMMLPGLSPMGGVLGSGDPVIQGLLPTAQYMLPSPMTSQQIMMANQFMGQGPMSPGGMSGMGVRGRGTPRLGGVSTPLVGTPGGYYPGMYYSS